MIVTNCFSLCSYFIVNFQPKERATDDLYKGLFDVFGTLDQQATYAVKFEGERVGVILSLNIEIRALVSLGEHWRFNSCMYFSMKLRSKTLEERLPILPRVT